MADRPTVLERTQIGVETTSGTAVDCTKQPKAFDLRLDAAVDFDKVGPAGQLLDTDVFPRREWSTFQVQGVPCYRSLVYPLSGILGAAVITTPSGGTNSRLWTWTFSSSGGNTLKSFTIQNGDGTTAEQAAYGMFNSVGLKFSRSSAQELSGEGFAQKIDHSATLTSTPTEIEIKPISADELDIYADDTDSGIGTTKFTRSFVAEVELGDRYVPNWPINSSVASFGFAQIQKPKFTFKLQLGNDPTGRAYITNMRAGSTKFIRLQASGDNIEGSIPWRLRLDMAAKVASAPKREDIDNNAVLDIEFDIVHDATWGKGMVVTLQNDLTAL